MQAAELRNRASEVLQKIQGLLESLVGWVMRTSGRVARIQELIARAGPRPSEASIATPEGTEALSWWAVSGSAPMAFEPLHLGCEIPEGRSSVWLVLTHAASRLGTFQT